MDAHWPRAGAHASHSLTRGLLLVKRATLSSMKRSYCCLTRHLLWLRWKPSMLLSSSSILSPKTHTLSSKHFYIFILLTHLFHSQVKQISLFKNGKILNTAKKVVKHGFDFDQLLMKSNSSSSFDGLLQNVSHGFNYFRIKEIKFDNNNIKPFIIAWTIYLARFCSSWFFN